jgi:NADH dehydrogenase
MVSKERVVIIGGGFGGLYAARCLRASDKEIILVEKTNYHLFQPLLYQVATAALSGTDIAIPIRQVLKNQQNTSVIMGEVVDVDRISKKVSLKDGHSLSYDYLILAVGTETSYFGKEDWKEKAPGLKTLEDAFTIRDRILLSFEKAETTRDSSEKEKHLTFVIIGGGPTGIELSGAIAEISRKTLYRNFRNFNPADAKIYLIEGAERILPHFPESLSIKAGKCLQNLGVTVRTSQKVTAIEEDFVRTAEKTISSSNIFWTAGTRSSGMLKTLMVPLDGMGRVRVRPDLSVPGDPGVFVIGDAAASEDGHGGYLPGIAPVAIQQAKFVCKLIEKALPPGERPSFKYRDKGLLATIGKNKAVASIWRLKVNGLIAWLLWLFIHILYLIFFRNKIIVLINWFYLYVTGRRSARIISNSRR